MKIAFASRMPTSLTTVRATAAAICLAVLLGGAGPSLGETQTSDPVVAVVNGTQLHESDLAAVNQIVGRNIPTQDAVERRESVLNMIIDAMLLAQIANERKIVDQADIERRVTFARNQGLADHLLTVTGKDAVNDESVRKTYDEMTQKSPKSEPEVHLRQMFFRVKDAKDDTATNVAQDKAEAALKRLKGGDAFAAVFAEMSDDAALAPIGGDQGWRIRAELGKEIADAAFALKAGEVSPVIKTAAGFHIIEVEEHRDRKPATFEQIKGRLADILSSKAQFDLIRKARESAKIERVDAAASADRAAKSN
jgi:peptidylprolyl isomerase/peptidyl-prolyl cis-trans isomerase C